MTPPMKNSSRLPEERKGSALAKGCPCEEESDLACLIHLCPEEFSVNAIISPGNDLTATIRPYVPSEIVGHWTTEPYLVVASAE